MIDVDTIAPLRGERPDGAPKVRRRVPAATSEGMNRRSILGGAMAAGTTVGLTALGAFGPARSAFAAGYKPISNSGYYDILSSCPPDGFHAQCSPGCGPSVVCAMCCRTSGWAKGYHRSGVSNPGAYRLRPNQCYAGKWDGWLWHHTTACGGCKHSVTWRCHDGWKKSRYGVWYKTICRWAVACS
jgi:hypothetical protein